MLKMYKSQRECHSTANYLEMSALHSLSFSNKKVNLIPKGDKPFHELQWLCRIGEASCSKCLMSILQLFSVSFHQGFMRKMVAG